MTKQEYNELRDALSLIISGEMDDTAYSAGLTLITKILKKQRKKWEYAAKPTANPGARGGDDK